ncbi:hypothetical protein P3T73_11690 [Kiritimatiellota bacterium B12222]|nr:hypothetical protein P3T73_11690 [Kiritimatiellota bacterium B12222]
MKKTTAILLLLTLTNTLFAMGKKPPEGVSILLMPAQPALIQLGMDMAQQNHALLMSYEEGTPVDQLFLHIWDGNKWLPVPQSKYEDGSFLKNPASRVLIVGAENNLTATLIEDAMMWSPEALHLQNTNVTDLINQMGRLYNFNKADWEWISTRYDLQLEDLSAGQIQSSWYDNTKASDLPPSEKPWKKKQMAPAELPPKTSLSPVETVIISEGVVLEGEEVQRPTSSAPQAIEEVNLGQE